MVDPDPSVITLRLSTVARIGIGALVLAALGVGVGIGLVASSSPTASVNASTNDKDDPPTATTTANPAPNVVSACNADAKTVQVALAAYEAQTGNNSPAAISTNGGGSSGNYLVPDYLQSWPQNIGSNYAISVVAGGQVQVTVASTATPWSGGTFNPGTGTAIAYSGTACDSAGM